jgi:hypothetical protein
VLLSSGYNGGAWNGNGIRSSSAAADTTKALGYAASTDLFSVFPASFAGQNIDNTTVVVRYTFYGDATLDRAVNQADHDVLAANWQQSPRRFSQADFNYDTRVDARDLLLMASNWQQTWPAPVQAQALMSNQAIDSNWASVSDEILDSVQHKGELSSYR